MLPSETRPGPPDIPETGPFPELAHRQPGKHATIRLETPAHRTLRAAIEYWVNPIMEVGDGPFRSEGEMVLARAQACGMTDSEAQRFLTTYLPAGLSQAPCPNGRKAVVLHGSAGWERNEHGRKVFRGSTLKMGRHARDEAAEALAPEATWTLFREAFGIPRIEASESRATAVEEPRSGQYLLVL